MDCWHCRKTGVGMCRFCGRAICENHVETRPYILDLYGEGEGTRALIVEDALYFGACRPRANPVELPELS